MVTLYLLLALGIGSSDARIFAIFQTEEACAKDKAQLDSLHGTDWQGHKIIETKNICVAWNLSETK